MSAPMYSSMYSESPPVRTGAAHATIAPYGAYRTRDDSDVILCVQQEEEWNRFCATFLTRAELIDDPRFRTVAERVTNRAELDAIISARVQELSLTEVNALLDEAQLPHGPINGVRALRDHPQHLARHRWTEVGIPGGKMAALLPPIDFEGDTPPMGDVPVLGDSTTTVLTELGVTPEELH